MVLENLSKSWDNQVQQKVEETEQTEGLWETKHCGINCHLYPNISKT